MISITTNEFSASWPKLSLAKGALFMPGEVSGKKSIRKRLDAAALDLNAAARLLEHALELATLPIQEKAEGALVAHELGDPGGVYLPLDVRRGRARRN